ncbi:DUF6269 family protein [Streptomyces sp. NPDC050504]|uniref:DUF6269 family protein n=1 Tax=Streptomyces sp. NPDC050504 TaxID=3365618 RepID=UPI0037BBA3BA
MYRDGVDPAEGEHPLLVLDRIEEDFAREQELGLRDMGATPWAELLVEYVDALTELAGDASEFHLEDGPGPGGG